MIDAPAVSLDIVSAEDLPERVRPFLRPGEAMEGAAPGAVLPSHFYEIPSWEASMEVQLAPNFGVWELIDVDYREAEAVRLYPRYIPCALAVMAGYLQTLRAEVGRVIRIAANGGYRSPSHELSHTGSPHCWGTAVNIYRIGDDWMDSEAAIERYRDIAKRVLPAAWVPPFGATPGHVFDHLHIDIGYFSVIPHDGGPDATE